MALTPGGAFREDRGPRLVIITERIYNYARHKSKALPTEGGGAGF